MSLEYTTVVRDVRAVNGQHPNFPHDPFADWTAEGWQLVTASIRTDSPSSAGVIVALLSRERREPK